MLNQTIKYGYRYQERVVSMLVSTFARTVPELGIIRKAGKALHA
jgi:hypothetical protein